MQNKINLSDFLSEQIKLWDLARENYSKLKNVLEKKFTIGSRKVIIQYNPEREKSTTAKVEFKKDNSKCILCEHNLPPKQIKLEIIKDFYLLVNPFPIFTEHFTVAHKNHIPQKFYNSFLQFLQIAENIGHDYFVFYNGPKSGASIPSHLHFQIGVTKEIPLRIENKKKEIEIIKDELGGYNVFSGDSAEEIQSVIFNFLNLQNSEEEPMMNVLANYKNNIWTVIIFLRKAHRPTFYFLENKEQIIVSPATIDVAGKMILPRKEDYKKITKEIIQQIFQEVILSF